MLFPQQIMSFYLSYNTKKLKFCDFNSVTVVGYFIFIQLPPVFFNVQSVKILTLNHLLPLINNDNFPITESEEMKCYIHGVSPVKDAQFSGRKYFNCTVKKKMVLSAQYVSLPINIRNLLHYKKQKAR